ncbi:glycosyltransferase family 4 protein [Halogeometricum borinquense]|uniref:Glycosyltransferase family 4 protein n=1 Tax=Halogeometricum borinquense TaxID=60847 RepID=A0A6C0UG95_9EURY|nr:glycosyltransferase family 4 protein [Halogeometricum borinquense]QIB74227.1 glycosyltransferase family 4 protein [Halogeometricum borinquense]
MKVGIVTDAFPPEVGGIQTFADQFVTRLSETPEVDQVDVLAFTPGDDEEHQNLSIQRVDTDNTPKKLLVGLLWARRHSFDIIHSLTLYQSGLVAALAGGLDDSINTFSTVYGLDALSLADHPVLGPVHRYMFSNLDEILFFSDSTREKTHDKYEMEFTSRRIYPGAPWFDETETDGSGPISNFTVPEEDFVVLTVARLVKRKGIDDLVEAVSSMSNVTLLVAGDGEERRALEQQVPPEAEDRVKFLGQVPHGQLPDLYERSDVFCLPSVYLRDQGDIEGLGLVFLEAQKFGLPVIGTRSGGIPEALADGRTGFLVNERSPDEIQRRIAELRDQREKYQEFSENALSFAEEQFSWDNCIAEHIDAYES